MASGFFKPSRVFAVLIMVAAAGWIASGSLAPSQDHEAPVAEPTPQAPVVPIQKVTVAATVPQEHQRRITLSCTTEADRSSIAVARAAGILTDLQVDRGSEVEAGQTIANISDEGRGANVLQAQALLDQRIAEYDAIKSLIDKGQSPKNQLPALEAAVAAARAAVASAEAEADRSIIRAPISGIVQSVPVQVGQAIQAGVEIAAIIAPDPMLAVGSISERERGNVRVGQTATMRFIDGTTRSGVIDYVGVSADKATRTYPVQARMDNADSAVGDGVTCEMAVRTEAVSAVSVPRSALVFTADGGLGVRVVDSDSRARFVAIAIVDDAIDSVWVSGVDGPARVIVVGQDFVRDGDQVEAVLLADAPGAGPPA